MYTGKAIIEGTTDAICFGAITLILGTIVFVPFLLF